MKRLAFWILAAVALTTFMGRRYPHPPAWAHDYPRPSPEIFEVRTHPVVLDAQGRPVFLAQNGMPQPPTPPRVHRKPMPKSRPTPPAPVETVASDHKLPPDWYPKTREEEDARTKSDAQGQRVLISQLAGTEAKARADLRHKIDREVAQWLSGDVAPGWKPPAEAVDKLIRATYTQPLIEDVGAIFKDLDDMVTIYRAGAKVDFSPMARAQVVNIHDRQAVRDRMIKGGGVLAFVLVVLASLSGYIRADEATKGYYTNRLRLLTAAGVGAAGVVIYQMLA